MRSKRRSACPERESNADAPLLQEPLSPEELHAHELRLRSFLESLEGGVEGVETELLRPSGGERFQPVDEAPEETALEVGLGALAVEDQLGYEIREALERLRDGTFGTCVSCGEWIARNRLQLVPYARECIACAAKHG